MACLHLNGVMHVSMTICPSQSVQATIRDIVAMMVDLWAYMKDPSPSDSIVMAASQMKDSH